jgi:hypothetical protein
MAAILPEQLRGAGQRRLAALAAELGRADPAGSVSAASRLLCCALGELGVASYQALGGRTAGEAVGLGAAALALLTKIDDEVIDARAFHGGGLGARDELAAKTRAFLAPTLASLRAAAPARSEPRCGFAAMVGRALRELCAPGREPRLVRLLGAIEQGWEIQVQAVTVLSAAPASVSSAEVVSTSRAISGAWLSMMVLCGALPVDATEPVSEAEIEAIWDWGSFIQRTDALCDLAKDQRDGLGSTYVGWRAHQSGFGHGGMRELYHHVAARDIDLECLPSEAERRRLGRALARLGRVSGLLEWIHHMLLGRYLSHDCCARASRLPTEVQPCSGL